MSASTTAGEAPHDRSDSINCRVDYAPAPRIKYFSGKAVYQTQFFVDESLKDKEVAIELGSVKDVGIAHVYLNGTDLASSGDRPSESQSGTQSGRGKPTSNRSRQQLAERLIGDRSLPGTDA